MQAAAKQEPETERERIDALIEVARNFGGRGWTPATSGNYSLRLDDGSIVVTRSGATKRKLQRTDLMRLNAQGTPQEDARPSAETLLHSGFGFQCRRQRRAHPALLLCKRRRYPECRRRQASHGRGGPAPARRGFARMNAGAPRARRSPCSRSADGYNIRSLSMPDPRTA